MNKVSIRFNLSKEGYTGMGDFSFAITEIGRIIHSVLKDSKSFHIKKLVCSFDEHLIGEIEYNVESIDDVNKLENTLSWLCRLINGNYIGVDFNDIDGVGIEILELAIVRGLDIAIVASGDKSYIEPKFDIKPHVYLSYSFVNANLSVTQRTFDKFSEATREKAIVDCDRWNICYPVVDNDIRGIDWRLAQVQKHIDAFTALRDNLIKLGGQRAREID